MPIGANQNQIAYYNRNVLLVVGQNTTCQKLCATTTFDGMMGERNIELKHINGSEYNMKLGVVIEEVVWIL